MRKRLDVKKLENAQLKQEYKMELRNWFEALNNSEDEGLYVETAENILGIREIKKKKRTGRQKKHGQKLKNAWLCKIFKPYLLKFYFFQHSIFCTTHSNLSESYDVCDVMHMK
jgi:hypothetical protein